MTSSSGEQNKSRTVFLAFHKILNHFTYSSNNYSPKRLYHLLDILQGEGYFSSNGRSGIRIELSFDDGYEHLIEIIPAIIEKYNLRPIVFIPTVWIGKNNNWDYSNSLLSVKHLSSESIKEISSVGAVIASHGHTHQSLIGMNSDQIRDELIQSKTILEDTTGERVTSISYPFGRCHRKVMQIAHECGYERGYTMKFPTENDSRLAIGRIGIWTFDTPFTILSKINPGVIQSIECLKASVTNRLSSGTTLLNRIRGERR